MKSQAKSLVVAGPSNPELLRQMNYPSVLGQLFSAKPRFIRGRANRKLEGNIRRAWEYKRGSHCR